MNMLAVSMLLMPVVAAFVLLYVPAVQASLNPGNEIMTASNYTFQSDTFSEEGAIGAVTNDPTDPVIITGRWSLNVQNGTVANFAANLTMVNASGAGYRMIELSNLTSTEVTVNENGTSLVKGVLQVTVDRTEKISGVDVTIALVKMRALNIALSEPDYLRQLIYGTADPPKTTTASPRLMPEGSGIFGNITEKFQLPQLPNPFR